MNASIPSSIGLSAWLEGTRIKLPLKGVEATFEVRGDLVSAVLDQIYYHDGSRPLDVIYSFPVPGGAAVYRCEMSVNGRIIAARIMPLAEARAKAAESKAAGHRTVLMEQVRENLFELAFSNLAPGDTVIIRTAWFQLLDFNGGEGAFRIPFSPGVRYIPGMPLLRRNSGMGTSDDTDEVPDASRLSPPRINAFHPDAAWLSIKGRVASQGIETARIASPSHTLVLRESDGYVSVGIGERDAVPDRDFVLRIPAASAASLTTAAWVSEEDGQQHALVRIMAPVTAPDSGLAHDVYFLVDRSSSMAGRNWSATCPAFRAFLRNLAPQDRAWVTFFAYSPRDLAEKPLPAAALLAETIVQQLEEWKPEGGTELFPALTHVISAMNRHSSGRHPVIILITDGQVGNESAILEHMQRLPHVRIFCYGIDSAVNDAFLRRLAVQQRGACVLTTPSDDFTGKVAGLASRLRQPVLTGIIPPEGWEPAGDVLPDLHAGESLSVPLRRTFAGPAGSLKFQAANAGGEATTLTCPVQTVTDPAISRVWAKQRMASLLDKSQPAEATALSVSANILCHLTAFVAWDESMRIVAPGTADMVYQPSMHRGQDFDLKVRHLYRMSALRPVQDDDIGTPPPGQAFMAAPCAGAAPGNPAAGLSGNSVRERGASAPLIPAAKPMNWRNKLRALVRIELPDSLLDWLEHWAQADTAATSARNAALDSLAVMLATHGQPVAALCGWLEEHMEPAFRDPALREVRKAFRLSGPTDREH